MNVEHFLESLAEKLHSSANVKTIYGDPLETQGKTIIPVARIAYGLGGGYGKMKPDTAAESSPEKRPAEGGGSGGGITVTPVGVIEVSQEQTRFIPLSRRTAKLAGAFLAGLFLGSLVQHRKRLK